MNEQYLLHLNNFKSHLEQLKICKGKVDARCEKASALQKDYANYLAPILQKTNELFENFKGSISELSLTKLNEFNTTLAFIREENNFFVNSFDVLSSGENELKSNLKNEVSKINFLVDAALKLKFFVSDRFGKIVEKYSDENHDELTTVKDEAIKITDELNIKASLINATASLLFASEMEASSKLQSLEITIGELIKRFSSIG